MEGWILRKKLLNIKKIKKTIYFLKIENVLKFKDFYIN